MDGRESTYFEWMGAGLYSADRRSSAMHGRLMLLHEMRYGFDEKRFYLRVDVFCRRACRTCATPNSASRFAPSRNCAWWCALRKAA